MGSRRIASMKWTVNNLSNFSLSAVIPGSCGPVRFGDMASEDDDALLFLIYQHLKVNGFHKAAKVLEKHVTQVKSLQS